MTLYRSYAAAFSGTTVVNLLLLKAGTTDLATGADWTPVAGDVTLSIDGGTRADVTDLPTYTNGQWRQTLTADELTGKSVYLAVVDSPTKAVNDLAVVIETYALESPSGDNAQHYGVRVNEVIDKIGYTLTGDFVEDIVEGVTGNGVVESYQPVGEEPSMGQLLYMIWSVLNSFTYAGDTLTTRKLDGTTAMTFTLDDADSPTGMERTT